MLIFHNVTYIMNRKGLGIRPEYESDVGGKVYGTRLEFIILIVESCSSLLAGVVQCSQLLPTLALYVLYSSKYL